MAIQTSAGSTIALTATLPATYDQAGFEGPATAPTAYSTVGEVTDIGEFGKEFNLVTHMPVGSRQVKKLKGSFNNGTIQLQMARDSSAGANQKVLKDALASDKSYAFRVTLQDGSKMYFTGKVMSYRTQVGGVDQITGATCSIEIDNEIVEVAAA